MPSKFRFSVWLRNCDPLSKPLFYLYLIDINSANSTSLPCIVYLRNVCVIYLVILFCFLIHRPEPCWPLGSCVILMSLTPRNSIWDDTWRCHDKLRLSMCICSPFIVNKRENKREFQFVHLFSFSRRNDLEQNCTLDLRGSHIIDHLLQCDIMLSVEIYRCFGGRYCIYLHDLEWNKSKQPTA